MADFLDILARDAVRTVMSGYYNVKNEESVSRRCISLEVSIRKCKHAPIIAEVKPHSPSHGVLRKINSLSDVVKAMERGGAIGISVLTEPRHFGGSLTALKEARNHTDLPILMKDIVVDSVQIEAASKFGANVVLLIYAIFRRGYANCSLEELIQLAHKFGLEVVLETHTKEEFMAALKTDADIVGINNRDLKTLKVDLRVTEQVLVDMKSHEKIVVSESGIQNVWDIRFLKVCGADAFLVGSAFMLAEDVEAKVRELVHAL
ncbi:MAG: indole-3-glycerol-phosphate synthase [Candidatus Bathyarchaeia archaeon]